MENVITQESSKDIEFNYYLPVNIVFGSGKVNKAGELAKPYGKKALIVTGKSSAKKSGLYDKVNDSLKQAGLETELFDKVSQNPLTSPSFTARNAIALEQSIMLPPPIATTTSQPFSLA